MGMDVQITDEGTGETSHPDKHDVVYDSVDSILIRERMANVESMHAPPMYGVVRATPESQSRRLLPSCPNSY